MNKKWTHSLFLAVFLFTMIPAGPAQAQPAAADVPRILRVEALAEAEVQSAPVEADSAQQAPIVAGTPVPFLSTGEKIQKEDTAGQPAAPAPAARAASAQNAAVGEGYYDDGDPAITWTGTWPTVNSPNAMGGSYRTSSTLNNTASLEFSTTRVSLIYAKGPGRGSVEIKIDGVLVTTLSMAATTEQWQQRWDSPIQTTPGPHTITLKHTGAGQVVVDLFEVSDPDPNAPLPPGWYEDTDYRFQYAGNWTNWSGGGVSGGTNHYSSTIGDTVSTTFTGTMITLYYLGYTNRGVADILIDGVKVTSLNQYSPSLVFQKSWQSPILEDNGPHTLTIRHASGAIVDIDALKVEDIQLPDPVGPGKYENSDPHLLFLGNWTHYNSVNASGGSGRYSSTVGSYTLMRFTGKQVSLIYTANVNNGNAEIRIDGQLVNTLNQYAPTQTFGKQWASPLLADEGPHTLTITHASGAIIDVDAVLVANPSAPVAGTYEDTNSFISYTGRWNPYPLASASGGSSRYSDQLGSTATFTFDGNQISLIYTAYGNRGTMDVRVDGVLMGTVNQNTKALMPQQRWDSPIIPGSGPHTLVLTHASGAITDIDAIIVSDAVVTPTPTPSTDSLTAGTYDDTNAKIFYTGNWVLYDHPSAHNGASRYSETIGDTVQFEFFGTQLSLLYTGYSNRGNMTIKIDDVVVHTLNQYSLGVTWKNRWDSQVLPSAGPHTVVLTHEKGLIMDLDAVIITGGGVDPTPTDTNTPTVTFTFTPTATPAFDPPDNKEVYRSSYAPAAAGDRPPSAPANLDSYGDSVTGNGRYVVFSSLASNLVFSGNVCGTNGFTDVYLHDRQTGTNQCLSTMLGAAVDASSSDPFISDTGQYVVFASKATAFSSGSAPAGISQIYLRNRSNGDTMLVSMPSSGGYANGDCYDPYITKDGQYVVFSSDATNLVDDDTNGSRDVFVRDMGDRGPGGSYSGSGQGTYMVSRKTDGNPISAGAQGSMGSFISDDGQYVSFTSDSPDLTGDPSGNIHQVFIRDLTTGENTLVSGVSSGGGKTPGNGSSWVYQMTTEGRYVMFYSIASNLVAGGNTTEDAYIYDRQLDKITQVSVPAAQAIDPFPPIEGGKIAFKTTKALVAADTNGRTDVYVRSMDGSLLLASLPVGASTTGMYLSQQPVISRDGRFVVFQSSVNALDPVTNPPVGGEPVLNNVYIRMLGERWSGPVAGTYDDTDASVQYSSGWQSQAGNGAYGGTFHFSDTAGQTASFSFKGRQLSLIYASFANRGTMEITIDGQVVGNLDQKTSTLQWLKRWNSPILSNDGPHTVILKNKAGGIVTLDGFEVKNATVVGPGVYDDAGGEIQFQGTWEEATIAGPYANTLKYTNAPGASASLTFQGMQVSLIYSKHTTRGPISIQIDNEEPVLLNTYGTSLQWQHRWDSPDLSEGVHTITLSQPGGTAYIDVDALIVTYPNYELDPPSPITDLDASPGADLGTVELTWTATGDDFNSGTAAQYLVRYSTSPIDSDEAWNGAADVEGEPLPQVSGSDEAMVVAGLTPGQFYYFAIRAKDDGNNVSGLSNSPGATAQADSNVGAGTYDDSNINILYGGSWSPYTSGGPYNNTLRLCNVPNSTATFTFTGTQISLIYTKYSSRGNIEITIDGGTPVLLNMYSKSLLWQQRWDSPILSPGTHTIVFRHPGGTKYIDIDALVVSNPEVVPPATVTDLVGATGAENGSVDLGWTAPGDDGMVGTAVEYVVRYANAPITSEAEWAAAKEVPGAPVPSAAGTHESLRVKGLDPTKLYYFAMRAIDDADNMSGISNSASAQPKMPDAVGVGKYDNVDPAILLIGAWETYNKSGPYNATLHLTNVADNKAMMRFTGTQVSLIYSKYPSRGNLEITIDGGTPILLNSYSKSLLWQQRWDSPMLSEGTHTLLLRHPGGTHYVDVDAIVVSQPETIPPAAISNLEAVSGAAMGAVDLNWTATGDDDMTGMAQSYIVRYASSAIDSQGAWDAAKDVEGEPAPVAPGGAQSMTVGGLVPGQTYYFAIRAVDDSSNMSGLSNSPSAVAKSPDPVGAGTYDDASGAIAFVGNWQTQISGGPYNSTMRFTNEVNAAAYFSFTGTQFSLIYTGYTTRGNMEIVIDGGEPIQLNQYSKALAWQKRWDSAVLPNGTHNVILRHPASGTHYVDVDAIIVTAP